MRIEHLEYLVSLNTLPTLQAVAEQYHITSSSISKSLTALEQELQLSLVERGRAGTLLTPIGKEIADISRTFLASLSDIQSRENYNHLCGTFRYQMTCTHGLLTNLYQQFEKYLSEIAPHVNLVLSNYHSLNKQMTLLLNGSISYTFAYFLNNTDSLLEDSLIFEPLVTGRLYCEIHKHLLNKALLSITQNELQKYPLDIWSGTYNQEDPFYQLLSNEFTFSKVTFSQTSMQHLKRIENGLSIDLRFLPDFEIPTGSENILLLPVEGNIIMHYGLLYAQDHCPCSFDANVIDLLKIFINSRKKGYI